MMGDVKVSRVDVHGGRMTRTTVTSDVLDQEAVIERRKDDGMVWLRAPGGMALNSDEAWAVAQALVGAEGVE